MQPLGNGRDYTNHTLNRTGNKQTNGYNADVMSTIGTAINDEVCIDLGYKDGHRLIVPESIRISKKGDLLVHTKRRVEGELVNRNYRIDRIQSAEIIGLSAKAMISGATGVALIESLINHPDTPAAQKGSE